MNRPLPSSIPKQSFLGKKHLQGLSRRRNGGNAPGKAASPTGSLRAILTTKRQTLYYAGIILSAIGRGDDADAIAAMLDGSRAAFTPETRHGFLERALQQAADRTAQMLLARFGALRASGTGLPLIHAAIARKSMMWGNLDELSMYVGGMTGPRAAPVGAPPLWPPMQSRLDMVDFLIGQGVDLHEPNPTNGESAMHVASRLQEREIVLLLVQRGADLGARNHDGVLAEDQAGVHPDIATLLRAGRHQQALVMGVAVAAPATTGRGRI